MSKKVIIGVVVIVLLLIGGGVYVLSSKNKSKSPSIGESNPQTNAGQNATGQTTPRSLKDILTAGIPQKCTYSDVTDSVNTEGTTYIADGKVRADFSSTVEGKTTAGHTIYDGKTSYVWMDGSSTGFKMEIDTSAPAPTGSTPSSQEGLDLNKSIDYSCGAWLPDTTLFTPPSDVTFSSFTIPSPSAENLPTGNENLCAQCNSLPDAQKAQCLSALKCD